jgi:mannose-6-phosphate isomerase
MNQTDKKVFKLHGKVQHYAWGGNLFLPELLHLPNPEHKPFAEYWLGAHDSASSELETAREETQKLNEYILINPSETLGEYVNNRFKRLPYLLKILDVKDMLSIQVHPSKENAENEFIQENKKSIPLNARQRNYKDDNHKPELMLAISEFWLLHGFKSKEKITRVLRETPELSFLAAVFEKSSFFGLYKAVMEFDQDIVNKVLQPLVERIVPKYLNGELRKDDENFWAARAALTFNEPGKIDRGIFSIYLFNLVNVHPGEAVFQDAGLPHAYLEGQNVEIMANSDNVLRGGLTPKHIDVTELLRHIQFTETIPAIIEGKALIAESIHVYHTPAVDFELWSFELARKEKIHHVAGSVEIFIVINGRVVVTEEKQQALTFQSGEAFVAFDHAAFQIEAEQNALVYRAGVPIPPDTKPRHE